MVRQIPSAPRGVAGRTYTSLALLFAVALLVYYAIGEQVQGLIASYGSVPNGNSPQRGADEVADAVGGGHVRGRDPWNCANHACANFDEFWAHACIVQVWR